MGLNSKSRFIRSRWQAALHNIRQRRRESLRPSSLLDRLMAYWIVSEYDADTTSLIEQTGGAAESFRSTLSQTDSWPSGHWIRWSVAHDGGTAISLVAASETSNGQALTGCSVAWSLHENG